MADDDENVRELAVAMLEELGYRVIAAEDGEAALAVIQKRRAVRPAGGRRGDAGAERRGGGAARARQSGRKLRVLFATGYADLAVYREGLEGEDMIRKPYRMTELAERVERALATLPVACPAGGLN